MRKRVLAHGRPRASRFESVLIVLGFTCLTFATTVNALGIADLVTTIASGLSLACFAALLLRGGRKPNRSAMKPYRMDADMTFAAEDSEVMADHITKVLDRIGVQVDSAHVRPMDPSDVNPESPLADDVRR
jgi:hypothetical protein